MYDDNFDLEIDNDWEYEVLTDDDSYIEEVDNREWTRFYIENDRNIEELIRGVDLD